MGSFVDAEGNRYTPRVTAWTIAQFEEATGVGIIEAAGDPGGLAKVMRSISRVMRLAYLACDREAAQRGVSYEDFCRMFDGAELAGLSEAMGEALANFFPAESAGTGGEQSGPPSPGPTSTAARPSPA